MIRRAKHAGSWYESDRQRLDNQLNYWLTNVAENETGVNESRAIISPHAGYHYSGKTAAYAFKRIRAEQTKRIFIFGPSHHFYLEGCALTRCEFYETPFYRLKIDRDIIQELYETKQFEWLDVNRDESEHSIEMQLPFIANVMQDRDFTIVPVLVGNSRPELETIYGQIFHKYFDRSENFFVISSDFCHWGGRFQYTYLPEPLTNAAAPIHERIEQLDREGIETIAKLDYTSFVAYLNRTENTICGRNPIRLLLKVILASKNTNNGTRSIQFQLLHYAQSEKCKTKRDTSVSYVAATFNDTPIKNSSL